VSSGSQPQSSRQGRGVLAKRGREAPAEEEESTMRRVALLLLVCAAARAAAVVTDGKTSGANPVIY